MLCHKVPGEVVHGQIIDVQSHFGHGVQIGHLRRAQEDNHLPLLHVEHLTWNGNNLTIHFDGS